MERVNWSEIWEVSPFHNSTLHLYSEFCEYGSYILYMEPGYFIYHYSVDSYYSNVSLNCDFSTIGQKLRIYSHIYSVFPQK